MSDAIRLIVGEDGPTRIAVGEADPIARREIAELQGDVTTLQEDVADIEEQLDDAVQPDGYFPALTSGAALSLTSPTAAEGTWAQRVTDAVDGVAVVDGILGNTIVQDGELLSVNLTGIETVGFNQWDEQWELGEYAGDGSKRARSNAIRSAGFIPCLPSTEYRWTCASHSSSDGVLNFYDADKTFISRLVGALNYTVTPPANARYMTFYIAPETTYNHDICINISNPALNGTYKPYATYQRTIPAATYFPNGMHSVGTVHDELTADAAIVRIGERAYQSGDEDSTSVVTDGTTTYYALATPTRTTIDPPLNMSYRIERGGTESVMHTDPTAVPTWRTRYPLDLAATVMVNIAPVEQAVATANHAIGDLLCIGWQLYRVTSAIAIGERIAAGTNVTATTVAAEIAAIQ